MKKKSSVSTRDKKFIEEDFRKRIFRIRSEEIESRIRKGWERENRVSNQVRFSFIPAKVRLFTFSLNDAARLRMILNYASRGISHRGIN